MRQSESLKQDKAMSSLEFPVVWHRIRCSGVYGLKAILRFVCSTMNIADAPSFIGISFIIIVYIAYL